MAAVDGDLRDTGAGARHRALVALARSLGPALHVDRVLAVAMEQLVPVLGCEAGQLWLLEGETLQLAALTPAPVERLDTPSLELGHGLPGVVALDRTARLGDPSTAAVPLLATGEVIGVFVVSGEVEFSDDDLAFIEAAGVQLGGALEAAHRFRQIMELERLKADFIARISHELRTPITIISGFLNTLMTHGEAIEPADRAHMISRSVNAVDRLGGLIGDLLMLSRIETGLLRADRRSADLNEVLTELVGEFETEVVKLDVPDRTPGVTDPALLSQALRYLVDNAVKYGGSAHIVAVAADGAWTVEVTDPGPGIAADVRDVVFELFTRGAGTTHVPGMGLGLAMARTIAEALGGDVHLVETGADIGTRICLSVPA